MAERTDVVRQMAPDDSNREKQQPSSKAVIPKKSQNEGASSVSEDKQADGGLIFITGGKPADFKRKRVMTTVRKKAMSYYLRMDGGNPAKKGSESPQRRLSTVDSIRSFDSDSGYAGTYKVAGSSVAASDGDMSRLRRDFLESWDDTIPFDPADPTSIKDPYHPGLFTSSGYPNANLPIQISDNADGSDVYSYLHTVPYRSPAYNFPQTSLLYPTPERLGEIGYGSQPALLGGSISLRELEYEYREPEHDDIKEEPDSAALKQETLAEHDHIIVEVKATPRDESRDYADSGISPSVREMELEAKKEHLQDIDMMLGDDDHFTISNDLDSGSTATQSKHNNVSGINDSPLSNGNRHKFLLSLQHRWDMRPGAPLSPVASKLILLLKRLARSQVEEATALFEAVVSTCPMNARSELLVSLLQHVEKELPLERWWTTAGTGDNRSSSANEAYNIFVKSLEDKWHLEQDGSRVEEANEVYEHIKHMFHASRAKLDAAMEFFESIAGSCDEDKWAELLYATLQQIKRGVSLEQWWASVNDQHAEKDEPEKLRSGFPSKMPSESLSKLSDGKDITSIRRLSSNSQQSSDSLLSSKHRRGPWSQHEDQWLVNLVARNGPHNWVRISQEIGSRSPKQCRERYHQTLKPSSDHNPIRRKRIPAVLPSGALDRDSGYFFEHDASMSRLATPQSLPSLTEVSTMSPQSWPSPWTPAAIESTTLDNASTLAQSHMEAIMEVDDPREPCDIADQQPLHQSGQKLSSRYQNPDGSAMTRRKIQNRLAQKAFFARKKRREKAEGEEQQNSEEEETVPNAESDTTNVNVSQELLMYQLPNEQVLIHCVCGNVNDGRFIIPCITCGKWQHIRCYYQLAQDVVENHECVECDPRELNGQGKIQAKRPAEEDPILEVASTATQSAKRPRTVGAESSLVPSIKPLLPRNYHSILAAQSTYQSILSDTSSVLDYSYPTSAATTLLEYKPNYQNLLEDTPNSGFHYHQELFTSLTSKRGSHKIADQGRRNRINTALQELYALLPPSKEKTAAQPVSDSNVSKAAMVESAVDYIKQLKKQLQERDSLLEEKDRQLEQLGTMDATDINIPRRSRTDMPDANAAAGESSKDPGTVGTLDSGFADDWVPMDSEHAFFAPISEHFHAQWDPGNFEVAQHDNNAPESVQNYDATQFNRGQQSANALNAIARSYGFPTYSYLAPLKVAHSPKQTLSNISHPEPMAIVDAVTSTGLNSDIKDEEVETHSLPELPEAVPDANLLVNSKPDLETDWTTVQANLPESWKWDVEYQPHHWTCTPLEHDEPEYYPLTIAGAPVVLPVEHQWPPIGGVNPPPDPRPSAPIDCTASLSLEIVRDLFLTFEKSIGFYLLINGLLQIIVPDNFDTAWASSHLPHKYGGLKVCYIGQTLEATMLPSTTETTKTRPNLNPQNTGLSSLFRQSRQSTASSSPTLRLNDFIEARPKANHRKEKYAGRIGLKVLKAGEPYLVMSTHIITEAILAKSHRETFFGRGRGRFDKLDNDWNGHVEIWAGNDKIGTVDKSFDKEAEVYPNGFHHDVTLVKPTSATSVRDIASPMSNLGWLSRDSWNSLRQQTSAVKILGPTEDHRTAKSIKCSRPSEILVVGEGIFLNQTASAGTSKSLKDHDMSTWKNLVSCALLYRVHPDFDPPNGHSGVALYADGIREDGSHGPGIVGFQSFVQRSGHVQNFNMEGPALEKRLQMGRVAFYGAFEVPEELKREYTIA